MARSSTSKSAKAPSVLSTKRLTRRIGKAATVARTSLLIEKKPRGRYFAQAAATSNLLSLCKNSISEKSRIYVKDKAGKCFMTLDPIERYLGSIVIDVSAQYFKDHFSRFSSLIKDGLQFKLLFRGSSAVIYARRHTKYRDSLDHIIEKWREQIMEAASTKQQENRLLRAISAVSRQDEELNETVLKELKQLKLGIARLGIWHRPFEEGQLPGNNRRPSDDDELE